MALENTQSIVTIIGDGVTKAVALGFPILEASHLDVHGWKADGTAFQYTLGTHYTVTLTPEAAGAKATVTLAAALPVNWKLAIARTVPVVQTAVFDNQGGLQPKAVEGRLDYLTMIAQQLARQVGNALQISTIQIKVENVNLQLEKGTGMFNLIDHRVGLLERVNFRWIDLICTAVGGAAMYLVLKH